MTCKIKKDSYFIGVSFFNVNLKPLKCPHRICYLLQEFWSNNPMNIDLRKMLLIQ